ncbi:hypothetical protein C0989_002327 [Termitomyces sp. Mn162]|nr:hypothetical protein C0989_002327 [Termitomyces sp. Mn162]
MSAYNSMYNTASYLTNVYGQPVLESLYAPFYPGPPTDQYIPCHWTPDPNQAFYTPSISQGIPLGWRHPPTFSANGNNLHMYPGGYSAAPPNPTYLPPAHYYTYSVPAAAPTPSGPMDNYSPPCMPFPTQAPPSPRQQRVDAYAQQCNKMHPHPPHQPRLPNTSVTPEVWADRLLNFHECYLQGNLLETMQGTLGIDDNLRNELCTLVEEIHTSLNLHPFEDPLDPTCSFYVQCKEPVGTCNKPTGSRAPRPPFLPNHPRPPPAPMPNPPTDANYFGSPTLGGPPQWALGPTLGNAGQPPSRGPPNGGPPGGWGLAMDNFPPQHGNGNNYYYYYNAGLLPQAQNLQDDTCDALAWEGKLDIQKPEPFTSRNPRKWRSFLTQCLTMF